MFLFYIPQQRRWVLYVTLHP